VTDLSTNVRHRRSCRKPAAYISVLLLRRSGTSGGPPFTSGLTNRQNSRLLRIGRVLLLLPVGCGCAPCFCSTRSITGDASRVSDCAVSTSLSRRQGGSASGRRRQAAPRWRQWCARRCGRPDAVALLDCAVRSHLVATTSGRGALRPGQVSTEPLHSSPRCPRSLGRRRLRPDRSVRAWRRGAKREHRQPCPADRSWRVRDARKLTGA
jgi:hypothetical protein